jgi:hypothetical protein
MMTMFSKYAALTARNITMARSPAVAILGTNSSQYCHRLNGSISINETNHHHDGDDSGRPSNAMMKNPVPNFQDAHSAYEQKTTKELITAAACFRLCKVPFLVRNAERLLIVGRKILGGTIIDAVLKATLYGHFCAGEDQNRIRPVLKKLEASGVGSILDYVSLFFFTGFPNVCNGKLDEIMFLTFI